MDFWIPLIFHSRDVAKIFEPAVSDVRVSDSYSDSIVSLWFFGFWVCLIVWPIILRRLAISTIRNLFSSDVLFLESPCFWSKMDNIKVLYSWSFISFLISVFWLPNCLKFLDSATTRRCKFVALYIVFTIPNLPCLRFLPGTQFYLLQFVHGISMKTFKVCLCLLFVWTSFSSSSSSF